ncbi:melanocortin receptor 5-like [Orbicella faveolata]|uniref:melanocortin receptor 5-like n=1 Tax=Orbicella faveolata TaxID=48498 RepID=UPI0009E4E76C|nr:melanocortin receptor 5-like [Orbicella faveolata]
METPSCEVHVLQYFPLNTEVRDFRATYIANCVVSCFLCYNAIMLNIVTIHAIRKTCLPKTLKTLLLSLAVSDVCVGLLGQPFYISLLVKGLQQENPDCNTYMVFDLMMGLFPIASFLGVVAVSVDRFLAIQFHLRYQELVTYKRVVAVVISIWLTSLSFSLVALWVPSDVKFIILYVGGAVGFLLTTAVYIKIYLVVRRHKNQIQANRVQREAQASCETASFASLRKSAVGIFYVYLVFWVCYLPFFISMGHGNGLFPTASFSSVVAVGVDRLLAIQFHLRYQELVTYKHVVAMVISTWVLSTNFSLITLWVASNVKLTVLCLGGAAGLLLTTVVYTKVYLVVRRHKNQIQAQQIQQEAHTGEMTSFACLIKSAVGIFYVYIVFLICYLPLFICLVAIQTVDNPSIAIKRFFLFSSTLVFLNSSLNPVIYCWKMRHIRQAVLNLLRNISRRN